MYFVNRESLWIQLETFKKIRIDHWRFDVVLLEKKKLAVLWPLGFSEKTRDTKFNSNY